MFLSCTGNGEIAELLIEAGIDNDLKDMKKCTAMHRSIYSNAINVTDLLIRAKTDLRSPICSLYGRSIYQYIDQEIFGKMLRKHGKILQHSYCR